RLRPLVIVVAAMQINSAATVYSPASADSRNAAMQIPAAASARGVMALPGTAAASVNRTKMTKASRHTETRTSGGDQNTTASANRRARRQAEASGISQRTDKK